MNPFRLSVLALVATGLLAASPAVAQTWEVAGAAGGELAVAPALTGHGFLFLQAARSDTLGGTLRLTYNTDTVDVTLERLPLAERLELTVGMRGEALIAGLNLTTSSKANGCPTAASMRATRRGTLGCSATCLRTTRWSWTRRCAAGGSRTRAARPRTRCSCRRRPGTRRCGWRGSTGTSSCRAKSGRRTGCSRVTGFAFRVAAEMLLRGEAGAFGAEVAPGSLDPRNDADAERPRCVSGRPGHPASVRCAWPSS
ncbi:MAG: hypothetical protein IPG17_27595 [Sandaracinaceae bacterium]|nr:hypothetical protein [Sandaracinaceae bacterium]